MSEAVLDLDPATGSTPSRHHTLVAGAPEGMDALHLADRLTRSKQGTVLHVARDGQRADRLMQLLALVAPKVEVLSLPAWDCLPYDRVSPRSDIMATRLGTLGALTSQPDVAGRIVITTVNAFAQRVPGLDTISAGQLTIEKGGVLDREALLAYLGGNGYRRAGTVVDAGEYAVRGGIIDVFPTGDARPVRIDLFGDVVDGLRTFDPLTQRTVKNVDRLELKPVSEVVLGPEAIERFRIAYMQRFGAVSGDALFESITEGRPFAGMEHWLPLFEPDLATLFDYLPDDALIGFDPLAAEALALREKAIGEYFDARLHAHEQVQSMGVVPYRAIEPGALYVAEGELHRRLQAFERFTLSPYAPPPDKPAGVDRITDAGARAGRDFAPERTAKDGKLFDVLAAHIRSEREAGRHVVLAGHSDGSLERLRLLLVDHGIENTAALKRWADVFRGPGPHLAVMPLERGFTAGKLTVIAEQDILGDRLARAHKRKRRPDKVIADLTVLSEGDYVVHAEHGIGQYDGLITLEIANAPHDCLRLLYSGGDKLFVPVENLDVLSRYGAAEGQVQLDKLGGLGWQSRKAKVKERIQEIAGELIKVAAERALRRGDILETPPGAFDEFCARFPFEETEDQLSAIEAVVGDMASGRPMDRLICGDVGFGKTEVALRAACVAALQGKQVAVLAPTTLLVRQHYHSFKSRFAGFLIRVEQLSRFVTGKQARAVKDGIAEGDVNIVVGTHALLAKGVEFADLGLLIIDEEQHFGVQHKERLKQLKSEVHVLTMTATPIPRTLQMALGGMKDLSIIATPPVDRLAVHTFVMPADPVVLREALMREHYRGGQSFYVCPRVADQGKVMEDLQKLLPELRIAVANGRMPIKNLEEVMNAFYDRQIDVLLSTNIIESGLDVPNANTLIVHRADMFGLSQLYQLRGRVGRSKQRGYAYFTLPPNRMLGDTAERRLQVISGLDQLGAGFQLASHDLDIRGAGNLLGQEQSGQIKEVGYELYNAMLEEAVAEARERGEGAEKEPRRTDWMPQITVDAAALIPEAYIADLDLRLSVYRRLAGLRTSDEIDGFAAELHDRFGPIPTETEQLIKLVRIKQLCRSAGVAKVDAGPKAVVVGFHENRFERPERLVDWIASGKRPVKLRPDHKLVLAEASSSPQQRLRKIEGLVGQLAGLAA